MFKIVATPELMDQARQWRLKAHWLLNGYWLCVDITTNYYGYVQNKSACGERFIELKELNQEILTQLRLLHSLGFTPKEIVEIINE